MQQFKQSVAMLLMALGSTAAFAQEKLEATGIVTAPSGETLIGAAIMEKGTTNTCITDEDGHFKISVREGAVLVISYIGYDKQELPAMTDMTIVLKEDELNLQEVVVTGYTTQRKADLTGAVSVVAAKDLRKTSDTDPMRALQGKVAGMTITADGSPAGTGTVRIRGIGSFNS